MFFQKDPRDLELEKWIQDILPDPAGLEKGLQYVTG